MPVRLENLDSHVKELYWTVLHLRDPPEDAYELLNRFVDEARMRKGPGSLVHEIPELGPDASRAQLILWVQQLRTALTSR